MINAVMDIGSITTQANEFVVIAMLLNLVGVLFITKLNDDEEEIYAYLAYLYFGKHNKISNVKIHDIIHFLRREMLDFTAFPVFLFLICYWFSVKNIILTGQWFPVTVQ